MLNGFVVAGAVLLILPALTMRAIGLAPTPAGRLFHLANVLSEALPKLLGWTRGRAESGAAALGVVALVLWGIAMASPWAVLVGSGVGFVLLLLDVRLKRLEIAILGRNATHLDARRFQQDAHTRPQDFVGAFPSPSPHPNLVLNVAGPFVQRMPRLLLGDLPVGQPVQLEVVVGNHTEIPCVLSPRVRARVVGGSYRVEPAARELQRLQPGEVGTAVFTLRADAPTGAGRVEFELTYADRTEAVAVRVGSAFSPGDATLEGASIERYPGACRSAFAWRGDIDHYCTSTYQSIAGIGASFELGRRFRVPQTLFLSSRLTVDAEAADAFYRHFGVDRGQAQIPEFIQWMRDTVDFRLSAPYPWTSQKKYVVELGNHGHLHFGTDAAAAPENNWQVRVRMGQGNYPWLTGEPGSLAEQRDNAMECSRWFTELFNFTPRSWAMPDRTNDQHTAKAMEAAGCEVLSDSNIRTVHNVIYQPPPHHPEGTQAVELTKRYPGDPEHIYHYGMILYWLHRSWRRRIPMVFMSHQHLRLFDGPACARFTEAVLRYVLTRFNGDLFIDTVFGLGSYWKDAFSPTHKCLSVQVEGGVITVRNTGTRDWARVPVELTFSGARRATVLVDVPAGGTVSVPVLGSASR